MLPSQAAEFDPLLTHARRTILARIAEAGQYWFVALLAMGLALGIGYGIGGYVVFNTPVLTSGFAKLQTTVSGVGGCIPNGQFGQATGTTTCDGVNGSPPVIQFSTRTTFPIYVIALATVIGWLLFMVFAGVGLIALPVDMIKSYIYRPQVMITKTEYIRRGGEIGKKAKEVLDGLRAAQVDMRRNGRTRKSRRTLAALTSELTSLEEEEMKLREVYPQGEDAELSWAVTVIGYFFNFAGGICAAGISAMWLIHILVYMFLSPPPSPLLNTMFIQMDDVFGLFGTAAFAVFCFYLVLATLKGNFKLGLNFLFFSVHPMSPGNTLMSRRAAVNMRPGLLLTPRSQLPVQHWPRHALLNIHHPVLRVGTSAAPVTALRLLTPAQAFDEYANETSVNEIFGNEITNLKGIGAIFQYGVFGASPPRHKPREPATDA